MASVAVAVIMVVMGLALVQYATPCADAHLCTFLAALHPQAVGRWLRRLVVRVRMAQLDLLAYDLQMAGLWTDHHDCRLSAAMQQLQEQLADLSPITNSKDR